MSRGMREEGSLSKSSKSITIFAFSGRLEKLVGPAT